MLFIPKCFFLKYFCYQINNLIWIFLVFIDLLFHISAKLFPGINFDTFKVGKFCHQTLNPYPEWTEMDLADHIVFIKAALEFWHIFVSEKVPLIVHQWVILFEDDFAFLFHFENAWLLSFWGWNLAGVLLNGSLSDHGLHGFMVTLPWHAGVSDCSSCL